MNKKDEECAGVVIYDSIVYYRVSSTLVQVSQADRQRCQVERMGESRQRKILAVGL